MQRAMKAVVLVALLAPAGAWAQGKEDVKRQRDVIYGRKFGLAMTMDVFTPKKPNGAGVICVVSGGWFSDPRGINGAGYKDFLSRGYTVFAVVHGSQPKFTLPEVIGDMHRSVRFIRHNAKKFGIDPDRIGISGGSAGGHLSLMMGTAGRKGDPKATDPVDRESSAVQAVACFFPPTDFLNWSKKGDDYSDRKLRVPFTAAVDYHEFDKKTAMFTRITDKKKLKEIAASVSPITHVKKGSAPALIIHGDKDKLVPIYQAETIIEKYKNAKVLCKLIVRKDADHGWKDIQKDLALFADWFDEHLRKKGEKKGEKKKD
jgi:acetyl esterase/lipase